MNKGLAIAERRSWYRRQEEPLGHLIELTSQRQLGQEHDVCKHEGSDPSSSSQDLGPHDAEHRMPLRPMRQQLRETHDRVVGAELQVLIIERADLVCQLVDQGGLREAQHQIRVGFERLDAAPDERGLAQVIVGGPLEVAAAGEGQNVL